MYKRITMIALALALSLGMVGSVSAQNAVEGPMNQAPAGGDTNGQIGGTADDNQGFDWRWLLPLLAIPVLFLLFRKNDDRDEGIDRSGIQGYAGSKGGRSRAEDDEDAL
jgi:hypothetical protein